MDDLNQLIKTLFTELSLEIKDVKSQLKELSKLVREKNNNTVHVSTTSSIPSTVTIPTPVKKRPNIVNLEGVTIVEHISEGRHILIGPVYKNTELINDIKSMKGTRFSRDVKIEPNAGWYFKENMIDEMKNILDKHFIDYKIVKVDEYVKKDNCDKEHEEDYSSSHDDEDEWMSFSSPSHDEPKRRHVRLLKR